MASAEKIKEKRERIFRAVLGTDVPNFKSVILSNPNYQSVLGKSLNYVNIKFEDQQLADFARTYSKEIWGINVDDVVYWELTHIGKITWLLDNGAEFAEARLQEIQTKLKELAKVAIKKNNVFKLPTAMQRNTENLIAELEGIIDDAIFSGLTIPQPKDIISKANGTVHMNDVRDHFQKQIDEQNDPEYAEYFPNSKRNEKLSSLLNVYMKAFDQVASEKPVKVRKARVTKIVPEKMVRKLKYLKTFPELNLVSINPSDFIQANILWVYNTKTRKLGKYIAKDDKGLLLKGSTLLNYSEKESINKKLRKPKEIITRLMENGKVEQRRILETVKAKEQLMNGRINKDTILLRTF